MTLLTEADVYHALSYHLWKSGRELRDELRKEKSVEDPLGARTAPQFIRGTFRDVSIARIYIHLNNLEEQGFAERRERELTPEQLAVRSGLPKNEYRLTATGIRNRDKYEQRTASGLERQLEPAG